MKRAKSAPKAKSAPMSLGPIAGFHMKSLKLLILLILYFNDVQEQLKTNIHKKFCSERVLGFVMDYG